MSSFQAKWEEENKKKEDEFQQLIKTLRERQHSGESKDAVQAQDRERIYNELESTFTGENLHSLFFNADNVRFVCEMRGVELPQWFRDKYAHVFIKLARMNGKNV